VEDGSGLIKRRKAEEEMFRWGPTMGVPDLKLAQIARGWSSSRGWSSVQWGYTSLSGRIRQDFPDQPRPPSSRDFPCPSQITQPKPSTRCVVRQYMVDHMAGVADKADSALITGYILGWGGVKVAGDLTSIKEQEAK